MRIILISILIPVFAIFAFSIINPNLFEKYVNAAIESSYASAIKSLPQQTEKISNATKVATEKLPDLSQKIPKISYEEFASFYHDSSRELYKAYYSLIPQTKYQIDLTINNYKNGVSKTSRQLSGIFGLAKDGVEEAVDGTSVIFKKSAKETQRAFYKSGKLLGAQKNNLTTKVSTFFDKQKKVLTSQANSLTAQVGGFLGNTKRNTEGIWNRIYCPINNFFGGSACDNFNDQDSIEIVDENSRQEEKSDHQNTKTITREIVRVENPIYYGVTLEQLDERLKAFENQLDLSEGETVIIRRSGGSSGISEERLENQVIAIYESLNDSVQAVNQAADLSAEQAVTGGQYSFSGINGTFTGNINSVGGNFSGDISAANLTLSGVLNSSSTATSTFDGSVAATRFIGDGSQLTGINFPSGVWATSTDGVYYSSGNVGIGTSTPQKELSIVDLSGSPEISLFTKNNGVNSNWLLKNTWDTGGGTFSVGDSDGDYLYVDSSGYVGIGTSTPAAEFSVIGDGLFSGNVGIGNSNPSYDLDITGDIRTTGTIYSSTGAESIDPNSRRLHAANWSSSVDWGSRYLSDGVVGSLLSWANPTVIINPATASDKGLIVRGKTSQIGNLQEWQNSSGTALSVVDTDGNLRIGTSSDTFSSSLVVEGNNALTTDGDEFLALFYEDGVTPEASNALSSNADKALMVQGDGAAYIMGRDVTNDIEFVMGTSNTGVAFAGSLTNHGFDFRTNNTNRLRLFTNGDVSVTSGNLEIDTDSKYLQLGASQDAGITYDGTNMVFDSQLVGSGDFVFENGNVGIGTSTPETQLHVYGSEPFGLFENSASGGEWVRLSSGTAGSAIKFSNTGTFGFAAVSSKTDTSEAQTIHIDGSNNLSFKTTTKNTPITFGAEADFINNVGFGITNPNYAIHGTGEIHMEDGKIQVYPNDGSSADNTGNSALENIITNSNTAGTHVGLWVAEAITGGSSNSQAYGLNAFAYVENSASYTNPGSIKFNTVGGRYASRIIDSANVHSAAGASAYVDHDGSGTMTNAFAFLQEPNDVAAGNTITNSYGLYLSDGIGGGTITNQYGIYIEDLDYGSNNYAVYSDGTADSYFGGNVGIGTETPDAKLEIFDTGTQLRLTNTDTVDYTDIYTDSLGDLWIEPSGRDIVLSSSGASRFKMRDTGASIPFTGISIVDSSTYAAWGEAYTNNGGLTFQGYSAGNGLTGFFLQGHVGGSSPTAPAVQIEGWKFDGVDDRTAMAAGETILAVSPGNSTDVFVVEADGLTGIGTDSPMTGDNNTNLLDIGGSTQVNSAVEPLTSITGNRSGILALQLQNTNAAGEMRFISANDQDEYQAFTTPGSTITGSFGGINKNSSVFWFYSNNGGSARDMTMVNLSNANLNFGVNNDIQLRLNDTGGLSLGDTFISTDPGADNLIVEGSVGIGTNAPGTILEIKDSNPILTIDTTNQNEDSKIFFSEGGISAASLFYEGSAGAGTANNLHIRSELSGSEQNLLTIGLDGDVGIGTSTPTQALSVVGNGQFTAVASGAYSADLNLTADGTLTTSASDERLKRNIEKLDSSNVLDKINQLSPSTFVWKETGNSDIGLIAQEVENIIPEIVFTNKTDGYKGINYSRIPALLIAAVQELTQRVDEIQAQLSANVSNSISNIKNAIFETLTIGSEDKPSGITLYDEVTGKPYCLIISDGEIVNREGECGSIETEEENSSENSGANSGSSNNDTNDTNATSTATTTNDAATTTQEIATSTDETVEENEQQATSTNEVIEEESEEIIEESEEIIEEEIIEEEPEPVIEEELEPAPESEETL